MWDEITYPFPDFNSCTVEVWEGISNFTPHFTGHVITYSWQRTKNGCHNRTISSSFPRSNCWCWKPFISYDVTCKEQMIYYNINFYNIHIITCSWLSEIFDRQFQNHTGLQYASVGKQTRSKSKLKLEIVDQWSTRIPPPHMRGWHCSKSQGSHFESDIADNR